MPPNEVSPAESPTSTILSLRSRTSSLDSRQEARARRLDPEGDVLPNGGSPPGSPISTGLSVGSRRSSLAEIRAGMVDMTIGDLMESFPAVAQDALGEETTCPCCFVEYGKEAAEGVEGEHAIRTPCNHILGYQCMQAWLPKNNSCPTCRAELIEKRRYEIAFGSDDLSNVDYNDMSDFDTLRDARNLPEALILDGENASLPPLIIRADEAGYVLDGEHLLEIPRHFLRNAADDQLDNPNVEQRRVIFETVQAPEYDDEDRMFLNAELLKARARREWKLYQQLHGQANMNLPPSRWFGEDLGGTLDWRQDRALFRELRRRGAFDYPGMRQHFRTSDGSLKSDAVIFSELRDSGACWEIHHRWTISDEIVLWSDTTDGFHQSGYTGWYSRAGEDVGPNSVQDDGSGLHAFNAIAAVLGSRDFDLLARNVRTWESQPENNRSDRP